MTIKNVLLSSFKSGFYTHLRVVIESHYSGQSFTYTEWPLDDKIIRIRKAVSDDPTVKSVTLDDENGEMIAEFIPSIFSDADIASTAVFKYSILNNLDIKADSDYYKICGDDNDTTGVKKRYRHFGKKFKAKQDRVSYNSSSNTYRIYYKPNWDTYYFDFSPSGSPVNNCSSDAHCPATADFFSLSEGCENHYDWDPEEGYYKLCKPVLTKHYTDTTADISHYNICSYEDMGKCLSYYQTCPAPSESVYEFYWYKKLPECGLRRDFRYFPKDLKLSITDDFSRKVTVTNASAGTYTDHTTCPQEKKITAQ